MSQLRHLKDVEGKLARFKRMYADLALEHHLLKDVAKRLSQARQLEQSLAMQTEFGLSARRAGSRSVAVAFGPALPATGA